MSKAKLKKALVEYYEGYCLTVDVDEMLNTKVEDYGNRPTTVAKIAHAENFTVEETAAFCAGIEKFDVENLITAIKNHDYEFHPDVDEFNHLGDVLRDQLIEDGIIPGWLWTYINTERLGRDHSTEANCIFSNYGYFEIF